MSTVDRFFIGGDRVTPSGEARIEVVDPSTEVAIAMVPAGTPADVDLAVRAARATFPECCLEEFLETKSVLGYSGP